MMAHVGLFLFFLEFTLGSICAKDVNAGEKLPPPSTQPAGRHKLAASTISVSDIVQYGSTVTIHYTLTVDGKVVTSSVGRNSLTYVQGLGQIIPGMEEQLKNLKRGDKKHVTVPPNKGYGAIDFEAFQNVPRKSFKNHKSLKVGGIVTGQYKGISMQATIAAIDKKNVVLDLNHPLAGKTLEFDVEVMEIKHGN